MSRGVRLCVFAVAFSCALLVAGPHASALDPQSFAEVSDGVVKIRAHCPDGTTTGSGFLVGSSVVMTAHDVVAGCRGVAVWAKGKWVKAAAIRRWRDRHQGPDITTIQLAHAINNAWVFRLRRSQVPIHADVAVLGYPLGGRISYADGKVIARSRGHIALEIRSAPGESGGPVVDAQGRLVGVASLGNPSRGAFLIAYDISSRSAGWRRTLCRAYPHGGIQDCPGGGSASGGGTAPPPTPPPTTTAPAPVATPGHYCGFTNNGDALCFDITSGIPQTFTNLTFTVTYRGIECNPTATGTVNYTTGGAAVVQADNSFDFEVASGDQAGTFAKGTIMGNGTAAGTLNVHSVLSSGGTTYTCALTTDWTATKQ